jgi:hypothetical protein
MPARQSSSHDRPAKRDANGHSTPDAAIEDGPSAESVAADGKVGPDDSVAADADAVAEDVPMNRAARRAKNKAGSQPRPVGKILPARTNQSHGPRSYANRRSG